MSGNSPDSQTTKKVRKIARNWWEQLVPRAIDQWRNNYPVETTLQALEDHAQIARETGFGSQPSPSKEIVR